LTNSIQHQLLAAQYAAELPHLQGADRTVIYLRAQCHMAAAGGDYYGDARLGGPYGSYPYEGPLADGAEA
jgi:hypothetical protein